MMFRLEKFYSEGFDPIVYWDQKYSEEEIGGADDEEFTSQRFWRLLEKNLDPNGHYLDAGAGLGGWMLFLRRHGYRISGIDSSAQTVRALRVYDSSLDIQRGSVTALPYQDSQFDGVIMLGVLEYVDGKVDKALDEAYRVLKPGGFVFIEVPLLNGLRRWLYVPLKRAEKMIKQQQGREPIFSNYLFDRRSLQRRLQAAGFEIEAVQPHELPGAAQHYGLWLDWPGLRGKGDLPYTLNWLGRIVKIVGNAISPWLLSTGVVVAARKK